MEAADPAPEDGAEVESCLGPGGKAPAAVGGEESRAFLKDAWSPHPKIPHEGDFGPQPNGQDCAGDRTPSGLENGSAEVDVVDDPEHQSLLNEGGVAGNLVPQKHRPGEADIKDTPRHNHRPEEAGIEETLTHNHRPGEADIEEILKGIEGSLTLQDHRPKEACVKENVTQNHWLEEAVVDENLTHNHKPEEAGVDEALMHNHRPEEAGVEEALTHNHEPEEAGVDETLTHIHGPEETGVEETLMHNHRPEGAAIEGSFPHQNHEPAMAGTLTTQNGHEEPSIEGSLTLHNHRPEEAELEDTLTHNNQPVDAGIEATVDTENCIPSEVDIVSHLIPQKHTLEHCGMEETQLSPNQGTVDIRKKASSVPESKGHEEPGTEETQNHNPEEATAPQKEPLLEGSLAAEGDVSPACQQVLEQDGEESSGKDLTDSARTGDTLGNSTEFTSSPLVVDSIMEVPIPSLPVHQDEDITADGWRARRKHVFVLSEAGKPIYSRYGNEEALSSTMGVMMALVSFVQSGNNIIRSIYSGDHKVVFEQKGPLVLVSVSRTLQSEPQLRRELHYVYYQIISMLTQASVQRIFEHKKNYDLRRLLAGSEKILDSLLNLVETDASFLLGAVQCLPLTAWVRDALNAILLKAITPNLVFSIMLVNSQLVTVVQERAVIEDCRLDPTDLLLLLNLIRSSSAFQAGEIWTPICLPRFNPDGYFYAYISYLDPECTVCLILLSTDKDSFYSVSDCKKRIDENLRSQNLLQAIAAARQSHSYSASLVGVPDLRHFIYKPLDIPENCKQLTQFTSPDAEGPYCDDEERQRLFDLYRYLHSRIHCTSRPLKLIYHVAEKETLLAWVTSKFELYTSYSPLVTKAGAINVITKLLRWIKKEEDRLFIRYPPKYSTTPVPGKGTKSGRGGADKIDAAENGFFSGL